MQVIDLFPTPVGMFKNDNIQEHNELLSVDFENHKIYDMVISKDRNCLNNNKDRFPATYNFIQNSLQEFGKTALATSSELIFTQSWLTKHDNIPQQTFAHRHQNSILSGTYYINASKEDAGINFYKDNDLFEKYIKWEQEPKHVENNKYAWESIEVKAETGLLVIFPSWLKHAVNGNTKNNVRCSLAFNTWFKEQIGSEELLTLL